MFCRIKVLLFAATFAVLLLSQVNARTYFRISRAIQDETNDGKIKTCYKSSPCGWAIYKPFTREIVDYMPNTCKCAVNMECKRTEDDVGLSAYVHRCRPSTEDLSDPGSNLQIVSS